MNLTKVKSITLIDIFFSYPFKKNIVTENNVIPVPYIKKEDIVYNDYSLDYATWKKIVDRYLELVAESMKEGNQIKLPNRLGYLQVKRFKVKKFFDRIASSKNKKQTYKKNNDMENYMFFIDWMRNYKEAMFDFKWHWRFKPNRSFLKSLYDLAEKDYTFMNKFKIEK